MNQRQGRTRRIKRKARHEREHEHEHQHQHGHEQHGHEGEHEEECTLFALFSETHEGLPDGFVVNTAVNQVEEVTNRGWYMFFFGIEATAGLLLVLVNPNK